MDIKNIIDDEELEKISGGLTIYSEYPDRDKFHRGTIYARTVGPNGETSPWIPLEGDDLGNLEIKEPGKYHIQYLVVPSGSDL